MELDSEEALESSLGREIDRLAEEFRGTFGRETIARCARDSMEWLAGARVKKYLPTFTYRFTRERLRAMAGAEGLIRTSQPEILFVCLHNSGRSQMAAAFARALSRGRVEVHSAGTEPAGEINPAVAEAMAELGLDLSEEWFMPRARHHDG